MWEIIDNNGTIYSGNEDEIKIIYEQIIEGIIEESWNGDLRLTQIHEINN